MSPSSLLRNNHDPHYIFDNFVFISLDSYSTRDNGGLIMRDRLWWVDKIIIGVGVILALIYYVIWPLAIVWSVITLSYAPAPPVVPSFSQVISLAVAFLILLGTVIHGIRKIK